MMRMHDGMDGGEGGGFIAWWCLGLGHGCGVCVGDLGTFPLGVDGEQKAWACQEFPNGIS